MSEYVKRLGQTAVRFTGQPSAISPQLEDYNRIPNIRRPMEGDATHYRIILYVGYIDVSDIAITFPKQNVMCVTVKHGIKAIDALSHRLSKVAKVPQVIREAHCPLVCSREDVSCFALPSNVKKSSLTAHMSQDGFLVVQSRMLTVDDEGKTGFDTKRLVVVKVCRDLEPSLSSADCRTMALSLIEQAATLAATVVETLRPDSEDAKEGASGRGEASEQTAQNEDSWEEVVPEAAELTISEGSRVGQREPYFRTLHSRVETLRELTREAVADSRRLKEALDLSSRREPAVDESGERSQIKSSFTVFRRQQSKVLAKHVPRASSEPTRPESRETGESMRFKAIDMVVRNEGSPRRKDAKEKSCVSEPSTSARSDSVGSQGSVVDRPELQSKEPKSLGESSGAKSSKVGIVKETRSRRKILTEENVTKSKDSRKEIKVAQSMEPDVEEASEEKVSDSKDSGVEEKAPESKEPVVEEASEDKKLVEEDSESKRPSDSKDSVFEEKASENEASSYEKASDRKDSDVEEKAPEKKKHSDEKVSESKEPSLKKEETASAKTSLEKKPSPEKCAESEKVSHEKEPSPEKDTETEGKSDSKDPSPAREVKEQSSLVKESSQSSKTTSRRDSKSEPEAGGKAESLKKEPSVEKDTIKEGKSDSKEPSPAKEVKEQSSPVKESGQSSKTTRRRDSKSDPEGKAVSLKKEPSVEKDTIKEEKEPSPAKEVKEQSSPLKDSSQSSKTTSRKDSKSEPEVGGKGVSLKKEPSLEKDTIKEGKSDSKEPSPAKGHSSPVKESISQPSKTTRRGYSKTDSEAGDKVPQQRDPQEAKEKVATKSLPMRSTRSAVASLAAPPKPPASPSKVVRSKLKAEEAPGTPSKRIGKSKQKDTDSSKR